MPDAVGKCRPDQHPLHRCSKRARMFVAWTAASAATVVVAACSGGSGTPTASPSPSPIATATVGDWTGVNSHAFQSWSDANARLSEVLVNGPPSSTDLSPEDVEALYVACRGLIRALAEPASMTLSGNAQADALARTAIKQALTVGKECVAALRQTPPSNAHLDAAHTAYSASADALEALVSLSSSPADYADQTQTLAELPASESAAHICADLRRVVVSFKVKTKPEPASDGGRLYFVQAVVKNRSTRPVTVKVHAFLNDHDEVGYTGGDEVAVVSASSSRVVEIADGGLLTFPGDPEPTWEGRSWSARQDGWTVTSSRCVETSSG